MREQRLFALDLGGQQPALAGGQHGSIVAGVAPVVGDRELAIVGAGNALDAGTWRAVVQRCQAGTFGPVGATLRHMAPDTQWHLLDTADHQVLVIIAVGHHHAEDFQHRVGEVRIPAAGAETDLAEHFAVVEGQLGEGLGSGDEIVERAVVPQRYQGVPQILEAWHVAVANGLLDILELGAILQGIGPGVGHFLEQLGQVGQFLRVVGLAFQIDDGAARGGRQRVRERLGLQAQLVDVVVEGRGRHREAHAAQFGDDTFGTVEGLRAQAPTHFRGFVHHRLEAQLHQLVGRHQAGNASPDNRHFGTVIVRGNRTQASRVLDPVVKGEWKVRAENGDGFLAVCGVAIVLVHG
ncbi:hypothetical protein D3C84_303560 [compost metagenome]